MVVCSGEERVPVVHGRRQLLHTQVSLSLILITICETSIWRQKSLSLSSIFLQIFPLLQSLPCHTPDFATCKQSHWAQAQDLFHLLPIFHPLALHWPPQVLCGRLVRPDRLHGLRLPPVAEQGHDDALWRTQTDSKVRAAGYWSHGEGVGCFGLQVADLELQQSLDRRIFCCRLDKKRFLERNESAFMIPKKFEYLPIRLNYCQHPYISQSLLSLNANKNMLILGETRQSWCKNLSLR